MQAAQSYEKSHAKSYKVLLVEDEGLIAQDIAQRLEALGHTVSAIVSTGEEAVEAAAGAGIVLMDIRLDGPMDGIEAAKTIRRRFQIPVVFLTAHADRSMLERAKQAEPFGYIVKPVAPAALHTSIEIAVYKHSIERELTEREAWSKAVLGSLADAVAVADAEGRVRFLNPAAESLTGWSQAEARGQYLANVVSFSPHGRSSESHPRILQDGPVALALLRDAAVPLDREAQLTTRDGRTVPVEGNAAPVRAADGAIGTVLTFRDVSRRRWEEQQIRQSQKVEAAARVAAGVADDYASLLAVIRGQSERLFDQFADYSPARQSAEEIRQAAAAAEQITRKLAGFGKRQPAHLEPLSPNGVLRRMARVLETVAGPKVTVLVRPGANAGKVKADEGQFEQLLMNLTMHAGQTSAEGGEIRIETEAADSVGIAPGGYVRIGVSYSLGAKEAERPSDRNLIEDESLTLSVAHNIASEHGGFFSTHRTPDARACLEVLLPRWTEPVPADSLEPAMTHTVLLVEPSDIVRAELHKFFEAHGFNLWEAADAGEAIALAEVCDGALALVIAPDSEAAEIGKFFTGIRPEAAMLRIVEAPEQSSGELRRPYTQAALLERVQGLLEIGRPAAAESF